MLKDIEKYVNDQNLSFGIISAHDEEQSVSTNLDRNLQLARTVDKEGFKYIWLDGYWKGQNGTRYEEASLFVIAEPGENENLYNFLMEQAKAAKQEAFIYRNEADDTITIQNTNGETENVGKFKPNQLGDIYSRVSKNGDGRPFVFASRRLVRALGKFLY